MRYGGMADYTYSYSPTLSKRVAHTYAYEPGTQCYGASPRSLGKQCIRCIVDQLLSVERRCGDKFVEAVNSWIPTQGIRW